MIEECGGLPVESLEQKRSKYLFLVALTGIEPV
jgi:hypothetical protein